MALLWFAWCALLCVCGIAIALTIIVKSSASLFVGWSLAAKYLSVASKLLL